jgi:ABC-type tungstate transport system substrate-binding protein
MVFTTQEMILYSILAIVIAIAFSLRKLYSLELAILKLEQSITKTKPKTRRKKKK